MEWCTKFCALVGEISVSGLFYFFEVYIFTLVFGEDLFLLSFGVRIAGRTPVVLLRSTALPVGVLTKALLLCAGIVAFGVVVEADSKRERIKPRIRPKAMAKNTMKPTTRAKRHPRVLNIQRRFMDE